MAYNEQSFMKYHQRADTNVSIPDIKINDTNLDSTEEQQGHWTTHHHTDRRSSRDTSEFYRRKSSTGSVKQFQAHDPSDVSSPDNIQPNRDSYRRKSSSGSTPGFRGIGQYESRGSFSGSSSDLREPRSRSGSTTSFQGQSSVNGDPAEGDEQPPSILNLPDLYDYMSTPKSSPPDRATRGSVSESPPDGQRRRSINDISFNVPPRKSITEISPKMQAHIAKFEPPSDSRRSSDGMTLDVDPRQSSTGDVSDIGRRGSIRGETQDIGRQRSTREEVPDTGRRRSTREEMPDIERRRSTRGEIPMERRRSTREEISDMERRGSTREEIPGTERRRSTREETPDTERRRSTRGEIPMERRRSTREDTPDTERQKSTREEIPDMERRRSTREEIPYMERRRSTREEMPDTERRRSTREEMPDTERRRLTREEMPDMERRRSTREEIPYTERRRSTREEMPDTERRRSTREEIPDMERRRSTREEIPYTERRRSTKEEMPDTERRRSTREEIPDMERRRSTREEIPNAERRRSTREEIPDMERRRSTREEIPDMERRRSTREEIPDTERRRSTKEETADIRRRGSSREDSPNLVRRTSNREKARESEYGETNTLDGRLSANDNSGDLELRKGSARGSLRRGSPSESPDRRSRGSRSEVAPEEATESNIQIQRFTDNEDNSEDDIESDDRFLKSVQPYLKYRKSVSELEPYLEYQEEISRLTPRIRAQWSRNEGAPDRESRDSLGYEASDLEPEKSTTEDTGSRKLRRSSSTSSPDRRRSVDDEETEFQARKSSKTSMTNTQGHQSSRNSFSDHKSDDETPSVSEGLQVHLESILSISNSNPEDLDNIQRRKSPRGSVSKQDLGSDTDSSLDVELRLHAPVPNLEYRRSISDIVPGRGSLSESEPELLNYKVTSEREQVSRIFPGDTYSEELQRSGSSSPDVKPEPMVSNEPRKSMSMEVLDFMVRRFSSEPIPDHKSPVPADSKNEKLRELGAKSPRRSVAETDHRAHRGSTSGLEVPSPRGSTAAGSGPLSPRGSEAELETGQLEVAVSMEPRRSISMAVFDFLAGRLSDLGEPDELPASPSQEQDSSTERSNSPWGSIGKSPQGTEGGLEDRRSNRSSVGDLENERSFQDSVNDLEGRRSPRGSVGDLRDRRSSSGSVGDVVGHKSPRGSSDDSEDRSSPRELKAGRGIGGSFSGTIPMIRYPSSDSEADSTPDLDGLAGKSVPRPRSRQSNSDAAPEYQRRRSSIQEPQEGPLSDELESFVQRPTSPKPGWNTETPRKSPRGSVDDRSSPRGSRTDLDDHRSPRGSRAYLDDRESSVDSTASRDSRRSSRGSMKMESRGSFTETTNQYTPHSEDEAGDSYYPHGSGSDTESNLDVDWKIDEPEPRLEYRKSISDTVQSDESNNTEIELLSYRQNSEQEQDGLRTSSPDHNEHRRSLTEVPQYPEREETTSSPEPTASNEPRKSIGMEVLNFLVRRFSDEPISDDQSSPPTQLEEEDVSGSPAGSKTHSRRGSSTYLEDRRSSTGPSAGLEVRSPRGSTAGLEVRSPRGSTAGLEARSPRGSAAGLEARSPRGSTAGLEVRSPRGSTAGLETSSRRASIAGLEARSPRGSTAGLEARSPRGSTAGLEARSPRGSTAGLDTSSRRGSTASLEARSPRGSTASLEARSPRGSTAGLETSSRRGSISGLEARSPRGSTAGLEARSPRGSTAGLEVRSPRGSTAGLEVRSPRGSTTGLEVRSPRGSTAGLEVRSPRGSTAGLETSSRRGSTAGLETSSRRGSTAGLETSSRRGSTAGLEARSPRGSTAGLEARSPRGSTAALEAHSPRGSTAGLETSSRRGSIAGLEARSPRGSTAGLETSSRRGSTFEGRQSPRGSIAGLEAPSARGSEVELGVDVLDTPVSKEPRRSISMAVFDFLARRLSATPVPDGKSELAAKELDDSTELTESSRGSESRRSPRGSVGDVEGRRSRRGSVGDVEGRRSPRGSVGDLKGRISPRGSVGDLKGRISPRGSVGDVEGRRSRRGSVGDVEVRISPRGSVGDLAGRISPRGSVGDLDNLKVRRSPRGSSAGFTKEGHGRRLSSETEPLVNNEPRKSIGMEMFNYLVRRFSGVELGQDIDSQRTDFDDRRSSKGIVEPGFSSDDDLLIHTDDSEIDLAVPLRVNEEQSNRRSSLRYTERRKLKDSITDPTQPEVLGLDFIITEYYYMDTKTGDLYSYEVPNVHAALYQHIMTILCMPDLDKVEQELPIPSADFLRDSGMVEKPSAIDIIGPELMQAITRLEGLNGWTTMEALQEKIKKPLGSVTAVTFCGCGFLGVYLVGAATCLQQKAPSLLRGRLAGSSVGSLIATCLVCDVPLQVLRETLLQTAKASRNYLLGPFNPLFPLEEPLLMNLLEKLPEDAHIRATGRLHLSLTRASTLTNEVVSEYKSRDELLRAVLCCCFLPGISGFSVPTFQGRRYIDGGMSNNMPLKSPTTLSINAFTGEFDICPANDGNNYGPTSAFNQTLEMSPDNLRKFFLALVPPEPEELDLYFDQGYADTLKYIS